MSKGEAKKSTVTGRSEGFNAGKQCLRNAEHAIVGRSHGDERILEGLQ